MCFSVLYKRSVNARHFLKVTKGLFDESSSDEEIFTKAKTQAIGNSKYIQPKKLPVDLYDEEPPELKEETRTVAVEIEKVIYTYLFY